MSEQTGVPDGADKPRTVAHGMRLLADWCDSVDELVALDAKRLGMDITRGDDCQRDLRAWAAWLEQHPEVDAQLAAAAWPNGEAWT